MKHIVKRHSGSKVLRASTFYIGLYYLLTHKVPDIDLKKGAAV